MTLCLPRRVAIALVLFVVATRWSVAAAEGPDGGELERLLRVLRRGSEGERNRAAQRLYHLRDPRGDGAVRELAASADPVLRARGVWALAVVRPAGAERLLRRRLIDPTPAVRREAVVGLGALRPRAGLHWLRPRLADADRGVRGAAVRAVARYGPRALGTLWRVARRGPLDVRLLAVAAVAEIGTARAGRVLRRLARRGPPLVRLQAARQLLRRRDPLGRAVLCRLWRRGRRRALRLQAASALGLAPETACGARGGETGPPP